MRHRPLSITLISYLFIVAGGVGIIYHASELKNVATTPEVSLVLFIRLLAIIGGIFTLRRADWARLLLVAWIIYHVILSFYHSTAELIMHFALSIGVVISLFHPKANTYFKK